MNKAMTNPNKNTNANTSANDHHLPLRILIFLAGLGVNALGIALITKAGLGTSPISSVPYVLSLAFPQFSFGLFTFGINLLFILIQVLLLKRDFAPVQFLQIAANVLFSFGIDLAMALTGFLQPASLWTRLLCLVCGNAVLGFGIALEVAPRLIMVPGEGIVDAISRTAGRPFSLIKNLFDLSLMLLAALLSLLFFGGFKGIGVGTVISALLTGRFVSLYNRHLPFLNRIRFLSGEKAAASNETEFPEEETAGELASDRI